MTQIKAPVRTEPKAHPTAPRQPREEPLPTWRNTRPRGNPEPDQRDMERSRERLEALLGG